MPKNNFDKMIDEIIKNSPKNEADLSQLKKRMSKELGVPLATNAELITALDKRAEAADLLWLRKLLKKRAVRTMSGIAAVAVLTKPYPCPGKCAYCPTAKNVPQSYLPNEPAVMRALHCDYQPDYQVRYRLNALEANGHEPTKIELIVIGGTWSYYPAKYQYWYIANCFYAANNYREKKPLGKAPKISQTLASLKERLALEQKLNEKANYRIIGLTLETRPDYINEAELWRMRELGCTRVELGVQAIDDEILKLNNRGSDTQDIKQAMRLLKNFGFKITWHFMPALPGSNPTKDLEMYREAFTAEKDLPKVKFVNDTTTRELRKILSASAPENDYNPDQLKFYPTVVTKGSELYNWWKKGQYQPYPDDVLSKLIYDCKKYTPPFVRIIRLIRDIPSESILAGNKITNLRQIIQQAGNPCRCIRCREPKESSADEPELVIRKYRSAGGDEYFLSFEDKNEKTLYGFLRLRLPDKEQDLPFKHTALVRELHIYGMLTKVGETGPVQHKGLGKALLKAAEHLAVTAGCRRISVISGVGVRDYYRKLGYELNKSYLSKEL